MDFRRTLGIGLAILFLFAHGQRHAPAGWVIENQASAVTADGDRYLSNVVQTVVQAVCAPSLAPDGTVARPGQEVSVTPGGQAVLPYVLVNEGNQTFTFDLGWRKDPTSDWDPEAVRIYLDENRDGVVNPGEPEIHALTLAAEASAALVVRVKAPLAGSGSLWLTPFARCSSGEEDAENYARVRLVSGPALAVEKRMHPAQARPGETVSVTLRVRNLGDRPTGGEVTLRDELASLSGVSYKPGSASAPKGTIEFYDGASWTASEPSRVEAIRLRVSGLEVGEEAVLSFALKVAEDAPPTLVENIARAEGPGGPATARATLEILPLYRHHLGPRGNPEALPGGEGSADDRQSGVAIAGQPRCFSHTLWNAGNVEDRYDLVLSGLPDGVTATFQREDGGLLPLPVTLAPGGKLDFRVCYRVPEPRPGFEVELRAISEGSRQVNRTVDAIEEVLPAGGLRVEKRVEPEGPVVAGSELTYRIVLENTYPVDLHAVEVRDALDPHLRYLSSTPEGRYDNARHEVFWTLPVLLAGGRFEATLSVKVDPDAPDDTVIKNRVWVRSDELGEPLVSPEVENRVWSTQIQIRKRVTPLKVRVGERVTYEIELHNPGQVGVTLDLTDRPAEGLRYLAGSAEPSEPKQKDGVLVWRGITVPAGGTVRVRYAMRVLPGARSPLLNRAVAQGESAGGTAVATGWVQAKLLVEDPVFAERKGTLVGRVFFDVNRDGRYDPGKDRPLAGARLVLANGLQVVTDGEGRYAFRDLPPGVWLLALDPASAPFRPLPHPEALSGGYAHRVPVYGLAVSDFPLAVPKGWIEGYRRTRLVVGPLVVEKELIPLGEDRYRVVLKLRSSQALPELELRDPLPTGGEKRFDFARFEGEKTLTYELTGKVWLTDPEVRWRYP